MATPRDAAPHHAAARRRRDRRLPRARRLRGADVGRRLSGRGRRHPAVRAHRRRLFRHPRAAAPAAVGRAPPAGRPGARAGRALMLVLGLTGGVAMGKSTVAEMFAAEGAAVFDADKIVHALYAGAAVGPIEAAFPGVTSGGIVDRRRLAAQIAKDSLALARLEA